MRWLAVPLFMLAALLSACAANDAPPTTLTPFERTSTPTAAPAPSPATFGAEATPPANLQALLAADIAKRLGADASAFTLVSVEPVSWPNACLGVSEPDRVCAQAITPGWRAILRDGGGAEYRYHGSAARFIFVEDP